MIPSDLFHLERGNILFSLAKTLSMSIFLPTTLLPKLLSVDLQCCFVTVQFHAALLLKDPGHSR